jgi:predicted HicB family RNase H-like nuclease
MTNSVEPNSSNLKIRIQGTLQRAVVTEAAALGVTRAEIIRQALEDRYGLKLNRRAWIPGAARNK